MNGCVSMCMCKRTVCVYMYVYVYITNILYLCVYIVYVYMERSIRKWVLWILFYNIKFETIYLPKY